MSRSKAEALSAKDTLDGVSVLPAMPDGPTGEVKSGKITTGKGTNR